MSGRGVLGRFRQRRPYAGGYPQHSDARVVQTAEAPALSAAEYGFESRRGHLRAQPARHARIGGVARQLRPSPRVRAAEAWSGKKSSTESPGNCLARSARVSALRVTAATMGGLICAAPIARLVC